MKTTRRVEQVMGMPISLAMRGAHAETAQGDHAWRTALADLRAVDAMFSPYRDDSWIARLDRGEVDVVDCPPEVLEVLDIAEEARRRSLGAFEVWRTGADGSIHLDTNGLVKGWALQRAASNFEGLEDTDVCLSAGGDMVCVTRTPDSPGWRIGIENPHRTNELVAVIPVRDGAIATSGLAHRGAHITDPLTAATPTALASVTVVGDNLTWVDTDATAAFVLGEAAISWLLARGRTGLVVYADGTVEPYAPSTGSHSHHAIEH
jgi:FAD:protein FMN transferase